MQVWNVLHAARWKYRMQKKLPKICHLRTITQLCWVISSQLRHVSTKNKLVKQQYLLHTFSQYGELWPISGWDQFTSLAHPSKFQWVSGLGFVTAPTSLNRSQPNFAQCFAISWAGTLCVHFRRLLPHSGNFIRCKIHFASKSCVLSYIGSITARHSSNGCSQT